MRARGLAPGRVGRAVARRTGPRGGGHRSTAGQGGDLHQEKDRPNRCSQFGEDGPYGVVHRGAPQIGLGAADAHAAQGAGRTAGRGAIAAESDPGTAACPRGQGAGGPRGTIRASRAGDGAPTGAGTGRNYRTVVAAVGSSQDRSGRDGTAGPRAQQERPGVSVADERSRGGADGVGGLCRDHR